eukprot:6465930-Amphidinium_carterae.1
MGASGLALRALSPLPEVAAPALQGVERCPLVGAHPTHSCDLCFGVNLRLLEGFLGVLVGPVLPAIWLRPDFPLACHERRRRGRHRTLACFPGTHRLSQARSRSGGQHRWLGPVVPPLSPATQGISDKLLWCSHLALVSTRVHSWCLGCWGRPAQPGLPVIFLLRRRGSPWFDRRSQAVSTRLGAVRSRPTRLLTSSSRVEVPVHFLHFSMPV